MSASPGSLLVSQVVAGEEASLWVAKQFVADIKMFFPSLRVMAVEANRLLSLGEPLGRSVYFSGDLVEDGLSKASLSHSCVLLISQSGQTYPTLHAVRILAPICGENLWMLVGSEGTQMEMTLRKAYRSRGWSYKEDRVMVNHAGYRPAEPTSVAIIAAYHTLNVFLLRLLDAAVEEDCSETPKQTPSSPSTPAKPAITVMDSHGVREIRSMLVNSLHQDMVQITGCTDYGVPVDTAVHRSIVEQGERLGRHVKEPWTILIGVALYIVFSVVLGIPLVSLVVNVVAFMVGVHLEHFSLLHSEPDEKGGQMASWLIIVNMLDALLYVYMSKLLTWVLRLAQGRPLGARLGKRTMVIVDYPCIHMVSVNGALVVVMEDGGTVYMPIIRVL